MNERTRLSDLRRAARHWALIPFLLTVGAYISGIGPLLEPHLGIRALWALGPLLLVLDGLFWWWSARSWMFHVLLHEIDAKLTWRDRRGEILWLFDSVAIWSSATKAGYIIDYGTITTRSHDGQPSVTRRGDDYASAISAGLLTLYTDTAEAREAFLAELLKGVKK